MVELLHPGVYVEERRTGLAAIVGVSTSTYGTVGFTLRGPTDKAVLVTSYEEFARSFGGFTADSLVPTGIFAFFANGGRRAYVVRVVASDAVASAGFVTSDVVEEQIETGDGTVKAFAGNLAHVPAVEPGSVVITYKTLGTVVAPVAQSTDPTPTDGIADNFTFKAAITNPVVPGTVTVGTTEGAVPVAYTDSAFDGTLRNGGSVYGTIDYKTGHVSITTIAAPDAATDITMGWTEATASVSVLDDGLGGLTGATLTAPGTIDYDTGAYAFTVAVPSPAPHRNNAVLAAYTQRVFELDASSRGIWGDDLRVDVRGNDGGFARDTAAYSLFDVLVYLRDTDTAVFELQETYREVVFDDPASGSYFASLLNDPETGSDLVEVTTPSNEDIAPLSLGGLARTRSVGSGNGTATQFGSTTTADPDGFPTIPESRRTAALETPVSPGSIRITWRATGDTADRVITDDGAGNLTGAVDPAAAVGFNRVDYDTGKIAFQTTVAVGSVVSGIPAAAITAGRQITAAFRLEAAETTHQDSLTGGSDGVAGIGRNELTDPTLKENAMGMYALLAPDELLNVGIMDAAGDVTMAQDQVAEAETNGKWFIILSTPQGQTPQQARDYRRFTLGVSSSYAALYYPWIRIADPVTDLSLDIPPLGHLAGVYARTDSNKNVSKAPAGTEDGRLLFSIGLERKLSFGQLDILHPSQVNAIIDTPQTGRVVWGARSLELPQADFRYLQVRRLFNFLKASIFNSTHGFVFENVGAGLRTRIQMSASSFMLNLFNQGYFKGATPSQAYRVVCDETNNPVEVEEAGEVICDIYVAANKPGEFIRFRLQQTTPST